MELCLLATIILVKATTTCPGLRLHLHLGNSGARTKRVSVLIGNHLIEKFRPNARAFRMAIIGPLAVTVLMTVKSEYLTNEDTYKGIHDDDVCDKRPSFRHSCHLSCFAVRDVRETVMARFQSFVSHFVLLPVWLKVNQSVCTEKGSSLKPSLLSASH